MKFNETIFKMLKSQTIFSKIFKFLLFLIVGSVYIWM